MAELESVLATQGGWGEECPGGQEGQGERGAWAGQAGPCWEAGVEGCQGVGVEAGLEVGCLGEGKKEGW